MQKAISLILLKYWSKETHLKTNDPHFEREAQKYDNPIPSREYILELLQKRSSPATKAELIAILTPEDPEQQVGLIRRLRAMERDGQLVYTRNNSYALPERMDLIRGRVIAHRDGFGFLRPETGGDDHFLPPKQMDKLFHGDEILALPLKEDNRGRMMVRVVRIIEEKPKQIVGRFFIDSEIGSVVPDDNRTKHEIIIAKEDRNGARHSQVVLVEILKRGNSRMTATGKVLEVLGQDMQPGMEVEMALRSHNIPHAWPERLENELAGLKESVDEKAILGRRDLRQLPLVTIDGEDARDFDDAVYCERKKSGGWRLWVAIADVSHYVRMGSVLDTEAYNRATSVYFPDQVIPMLPELLSNGLCSINPEVDRLCMVCEMTVSESGRLSGYEFYEAVMNSHARFTYTKVAAILDGDEALRKQYAERVDDLKELHALYSALKQMRKQRGAIEFETEESRFIFNEQRKIDKVVPLIRNDAHKMIEECMILANVSAARFIEKQEGNALFRVHEHPGDQKLTNFREFLRDLNLSLEGGAKPKPADFAKLALDIVDRPDKGLIETMLLRSMKQAVYAPENDGHFGLALTAYAHFTSPIRRYPDLVVHRAIKFQLAKIAGQNKHRDTVTGGYHYLAEEMDALGEQCSMAERRADDATREVADKLKCEFMLDHLSLEFDGVVAAVTGFGLFVRLNDLHIDGLVHVTSLSNDYYHYDAVRQVLQGESSGTSYRLGDSVRVKVQSVNVDDRKIDFTLLDGSVTYNKRKSKAGKKGSAGRSKKEDTKAVEPTKSDSNKPRRRTKNKTDKSVLKTALKPSASGKKSVDPKAKPKKRNRRCKAKVPKS